MFPKLKRESASYTSIKNVAAFTRIYFGILCQIILLCDSFWFCVYHVTPFREDWLHVSLGDLALEHMLLYFLKYFAGTSMKQNVQWINVIFSYNFSQS